MTNSTNHIPDPSAAFDALTPLVEIVEYIDDVKQNPSNRASHLVVLLSEGHPLYAGRSANEVLKIRAYAMAGLEATGLNDAAMPYIRENLESAIHPYAIAAAAKALRSTINPEPELVELTFNAIFKIWQSDRPISFDTYKITWPQRDFRSGLTEIFETLTEFGSSAKPLLPALHELAKDDGQFSGTVYEELLTCIRNIEQEPEPHHARSKPVQEEDPRPVDLRQNNARQWPPRGLSLQDQNGALLRWEDFFGQKPTLLAYFYTRCGNPYKCTRTILNLAQIQRELEDRRLLGLVRLAAISYDAQFDTPAALRSYGDARNFQFNEDCSFFRVVGDFDLLIKQMELEVSYNQSQVSSHRIEMFLLDASGHVAKSFLRLQSQPAEVVDSLVALGRNETFY